MDRVSHALRRVAPADARDTGHLLLRSRHAPHQTNCQLGGYMPFSGG